MFVWDMWYLDSFGPGESKSIVLDLSYVDIFKQKHEEFINLNTIAEKLDFYNNNRNLFEFPYNKFDVRDFYESRFVFDFKPAPHFLETHIYNPWFIERSKEYLTYVSSTITGISFHSCDQLWEDFMDKKDSLPLLKGFIKHEKKRFKALCEEHAPGRFDYWYKYKITDAKVLAPRQELTKEYWKELLVLESVDYIIKLEKYKEKQGLGNPIEQLSPSISSSLENQNDRTGLETSSSPENPSKNKRGRPKKKDTTFLELFRGDETRMETFLQIMKRKGYITEAEKWNSEEFNPGELLPIIKYLEEAKIIKKIGNKAEQARIFNGRFGSVMADRSFRGEKQYSIDEALAEDLDVLKTLYSK